MENRYKFQLKLISASILFIMFFTFYQVGNLIGTYKTTISLVNYYDISELKLKYNNSKEIIYLNNSCQYNKKDILITKQEMLLKYYEKGYLELKDLKNE